MKRTHAAHWLLILGFVIGYTGYATASRNPLKMGTIVEKELKAENYYGHYIIRYITTDKAVPGDTMLYTTWFENTSDTPENDLYITNPIPEQTLYVPGSALGQDCDISFSIDQGKTYHPLHLLKIRGAAGTSRSARPSEYTHIRWHYRKTIQPKKRHSVAFKVKLL